MSSVVPNRLPIAATTSVTLTGTNFLPGAVPTIGGDYATLSNIVIVDENTITMDVTVAPGAVAGTEHAGVALYGTGAGPYTGSNALCFSCVTYY